jgi:plastocyanin
MRTVAFVAAVLAALAVPACGGDDAPVCENPRAVTNVTMDDFVYEPGCIEAQAGAELEIVNQGQAPHTFTLEIDEAAEVDVAAGERATLTVPDVPAGLYRVTCTYHPQMEAALRVGG